MLGFLSNLRDVKSALSAGMLLLLAAWLAFGHHLANVEADDTLTGNVAKLVTYLGPVPTIAAVTFLAYVLGVLLELDATVLRFLRWLPIAGEQFQESEGKRLRQHVEEVSARASLVRDPRELRKDIAPSGRELPPTWKSGAEEWMEADHDGKKAFARESAALVSDVMRQIYLDIDGLAHQLRKKDEKAYNQFDKARGESEFRAGLVIPVLVVALVCAVRMHVENYPAWSWLVVVIGGIAVPAVLMQRADASDSDSREAVYLGITEGDIEVAELQLLASQKKALQIPDVSLGGSSSDSRGQKD